MSVDAWVRCRCYEDGKTSAPPVPVTVDADGVLRPQAGDDVDQEVIDELEERVDQWLATACEHRGAAISVYLGTNAEWIEFLRQIESQRGRYPVLERELLTLGHVTTAPAAAGEALTEMKRLGVEMPPRWAEVAVDVERLFSSSVRERTPVLWSW